MIEKDKKSMENNWQEIAKPYNWDGKEGWKGRRNPLGEKLDKKSFYQRGVKRIQNSVIPFLKEKGLMETDFEKMKVLDLGCGAGRLTVALAKYFKFADGIDISEGAIQIARAENLGVKNLRFYLGNGFDLQIFTDETFDFVFSYQVFQHIPKKSIVINYLREIRRVLKEKGYLKVQVRGYPGYLPLGLVPWRYKGFDSFFITLSKKKKIPFPIIHKYDRMYGAFFKEKEIKKIIQEMGFSEVRTFYSPPGSRYLWISARK